MLFIGTSSVTTRTLLVNLPLIKGRLAPVPGAAKCREQPFLFLFQSIQSVFDVPCTRKLLQHNLPEQRSGHIAVQLLKPTKTHAAYRHWLSAGSTKLQHTFSKVSAPVHVQYKGTIESTFENLCLRPNIRPKGALAIGKSGGVVVSARRDA